MPETGNAYMWAPKGPGEKGKDDSRRLTGGSGWDRRAEEGGQGGHQETAVRRAEVLEKAFELSVTF